MDELRTKGLRALELHLKNEKNISTFESVVHRLSGGDADRYCDILYQLLEGDMSKRHSLKELLSDLKAGKYEWNHKHFLKVRSKQEERDNFIVNGFEEVEEGVVQCRKCKSYRVHSLQKQSRSGDEGMTVYAKCSECHHNWIEEG